MRIPNSLLVHTVRVETLIGSGAYGEVFADPVPLACFREGGTKMVRNAEGSQVVSTLRLYLAPGLAQLFTPGTRVKSGLYTTTVLSAVDHDDGGMGAPQHTEVACE